MKDLQSYANDFDKWIYSLLDLLRTRYYNVSVNRGRANSYFIYWTPFNFDEEYKTNSSRMYNITIPNTELLTYFESKQTPPPIKKLLK